YGAGRVAYARDAFSGLGLMNHVAEGTFDELLAETKAKAANKPKSKRRLGAPRGEQRPVDVEEAKIRRNELNHDVAPPVPPFWGAKQVSGINIKSLMPYLNEAMLYQFQWGYKKQGRSRKEFDAWAAKELRPIVNRVAEQSIRQKILQPAASYGYWKAAAQGNDLILFDENGTSEAARFSLPRQDKKDGLCIADFVQDVDADQRSVVGLQVVTMGERVSEAAREIFEADKYQDYLYLHGFGIEMTEALAEYVHKRIRTELGFGDEDAREPAKILKQNYRGARYSFGYPACPNLGDQRALLELLGAEAIGIRMADEDQLHPEQSTSALVLVHPQAKYFSV
ncbi:MAG: methionine synthase, partial [Alphaproteobacteria bacterium]|nr:methionine synthase [Alphaproteobacteria bacterium]